jgi:hypothetical protein
VSRQLAELETELVRPGATRLERLLAARVATCNLMAATADAIASNVMTGTGAVGREAIQRQRSANTMLLSAARTLATCQKLLKPPVSPLDMLRPQEERDPVRQTGRDPGERRFERTSTVPAVVAN